MFVASVTTNLSQRIGGRLVHLPAPVTFILSQLGGPADTSQPGTVAVDTVADALFQYEFMLTFAGLNPPAPKQKVFAYQPAFPEPQQSSSQYTTTLVRPVQVAGR